MPNILEEEDWDLLLWKIKKGECTPFLRAGSCSEKIPVSSIANELAKKYDYPMEDSYDLIRVAQFVAITEEDETVPRDEICNKIKELLKEITPKYFEVPDELVLGNIPEIQKEEAQKYLDDYFDELYIQVYWQDCREFAKELRTRWAEKEQAEKEAFNGGT